jgi:hypothetical protein
MLCKTGPAEPPFGPGDLASCGARTPQAVALSTNLTTLTNEVLCIEYNDRRH